MKNVFDMTHTKQVKAYCIVDPKTGLMVGKVIANINDGPAGSIYHVGRWDWTDQKNVRYNQKRASGSGYDKLQTCMEQMTFAGKHLLEFEWKKSIENMGFLVHNIL